MSSPAVDNNTFINDPGSETQDGSSSVFSDLTQGLQNLGQTVGTTYAAITNAQNQASQQARSSNNFQMFVVLAAVVAGLWIVFG